MSRTLARFAMGRRPNRDLLVAVVAVICAAGGVALSGDAVASCAPPPAKLIWSYPADGDVDVPTNARIFVLTTSVYELPQLTVNGRPVTTTNDGRLGYDAQLEPATKYRVDLPPFRYRPDDPPLSFTFTTGAGPAALTQPAAPVIKRIAALRERPLSQQCTDAWKLTDCYDTGQDTHLVFETASRPILFRVERWVGQSTSSTLKLWPGVCGDPEIYADGADCRGASYYVDAVNLAGEVTRVEARCEEPRGCAVAGAPARSGALPWLVALVLTLLAGPRLRRTARPGGETRGTAPRP
jgi:hypothetical protein